MFGRGMVTFTGVEGGINTATAEGMFLKQRRSDSVEVALDAWWKMCSYFRVR